MKTLVCSAVAAAMLLTSCTMPPADARPNVLVIIIDSLRARNLSCYGYQRQTTPHIDSLAGEGTLWVNCLSQGSWTLPSVTSILTGISAQSHGTGRRGFQEYQLHPDAPFLPGILRDRGYRTYGFFNVPHLSEANGFSRGFENYGCSWDVEHTADMVVRDFTQWADTLGEEDGFFAVLHIFDPHMPYNPPQPFDVRFGPRAEDFRTRWLTDETGEVADPENLGHYMDLYDGEIAFTDTQLGDLFAFLRSRGIAGNTVVVVIADHGEEFLEHGGVFHGHSFYQEVIHVPLIMCGPGVPAGRVDTAWVGQFDLAPTLLGLAGLEAPIEMEGVSLLNAEPIPDRIIPSSELFDSIEDLDNPWACSVVSHGIKNLRLYYDTAFVDMITDLREDPMELAYRGAENSALADGYMLLPRLWEPIPSEQDLAGNPILRDLGYF